MMMTTQEPRVPALSPRLSGPISSPDESTRIENAANCPDRTGRNALAIVAAAAGLAAGSGGHVTDSLQRSQLTVMWLVLVICTYTDSKFGRIRNAVVYPASTAILAIQAAISLSVWTGFESAADYHGLGADGVIRSLTGGTVCFMLMFLSFLTAGGGGGDVKLATLIGLALGPWVGLFAILYAYIVASLYLCLSGVIRIAVSAFRAGCLVPDSIRIPAAAPAIVYGSSTNGKGRGIWLRMSPFFLIGTILAVLEATMEISK